MSGDTIQILIAMIAYMLVVVGIGLFFAKRAQANSENYFLGGRSLGPWVAAMSAEASDMSGWLLMGLPGLAYWSGHWSGSRNLFKLAAGSQTAPPVLHGGRKFHYSTGFSQQPLP